MAPPDRRGSAGIVHRAWSHRCVLAAARIPATSTIMTVLQTRRLSLRRMSVDDSNFIVELLNDPSFLRFVGDKGVRTPEDARRYILTGPMDSYERHGFGLWLVQLRASETAIGMCGLLKRESLSDVDIGFAFLPQYRTKGYAYESAAAVMNYARTNLGLNRVVAIADDDNTGSHRVLEKIGMSFERRIRLSDDGPEIRLFVTLL